MFIRSSLPMAMFLGLVVVGCATTGRNESAAGTQGVVTGSVAARSLNGTAWVLADLGGTAVLDRVQPTLEFADSGKVAGNASCNRFFGSAKLSGDSISFGPLGTTKMACTDSSVGKQEATYLKALNDAERFQLNDRTLLIFSKGLTRPLRFTKKS